MFLKLENSCIYKFDVSEKDRVKIVLVNMVKEQYVCWEWAIHVIGMFKLSTNNISIVDYK